MKNKRKYEPVGSFNLSQPIMIVSDPSYEKNEWCWCSTNVQNCKTGRWNSFVNINHYTYTVEKKKYKDSRVASLFACHESVSKEVFGSIHWNDDFIRWTGNWKRLSDNIGVDSGQAGFFDLSKYGDNSLFDFEGKCGFGDKWYSNCCDQTLEKFAGIVSDCGVNASSGLGDGCYTVWGHETREGKIDALVLFFLPDNEEQNEDEWENQKEDLKCIIH